MKYISMKMLPNGSTPVAAAITHGDVYLFEHLKVRRVFRHPQARSEWMHTI